MQKASGSYRNYLILGKTVALVSEFAVEDLPSTELQPRFLRFCSKVLSLQQNTNDDDDDDDNDYDDDKVQIFSGTIQRVHKVSFPGAVYGNKTQFNGRIDTASVEPLFNIFTSEIETFVKPWVQRLNGKWHWNDCDTHLRLSIILKTLTLTRQEFLEV